MESLQFKVNVLSEDNTVKTGNLIESIGNYQEMKTALLGTNPQLGANQVTCTPCVKANKNDKLYIKFEFTLNGVRRGTCFISTTKSVALGEDVTTLKFGVFNINGEHIPLAYVDEMI